MTACTVLYARRYNMNNLEANDGDEEDDDDDENPK